MQSSAVVTLRVAVMLTCLIVAPLAAIFGSSLPKVISSLWQGKGLPATARDATAVDLRAQGGEAPVFGASVQPPGLDAPPAAAPGRDDAAPAWPAGGAAPPGQPSPQSAPSVPLRRAAPEAASSNSITQPTGELTQQIQRQLRELGATYYLLEFLGNSSTPYRFYCKMSIAGNPNHTHPFEATDADPVEAMSRVLDQVRQWRAGSQP